MEFRREERDMKLKDRQRKLQGETDKHTTCSLTCVSNSTAAHLCV
jgi:hypothetical protein